jgi:ABC-type cobalamin/Fe3+-siderophores transport system ATPase subunit
VARALIRRPSLLLVDEPTEGMDVGSQDAFLETLDDLHRSQGCTLLFVTHHLEIALRYATHVAVASEGTLLADRRDRVLEAGQLSRAFGDRGEVVARSLRSEGGS